MKRWPVPSCVLLSCLALTVTAAGSVFQPIAGKDNTAYTQAYARYVDIETSDSDIDSQADSASGIYSANAFASASVPGADATGAETYHVSADAVSGVSFTSSGLGLGVDFTLNTQYSSLAPLQHLEAYTEAMSTVHFTISSVNNPFGNVSVRVEGANLGGYWGETQNWPATTTYRLYDVTDAYEVFAMTEFDIYDHYLDTIMLKDFHEYSLSVEARTTLYESQKFPDTGFYVNNALCLGFEGTGATLPQLNLPEPDPPFNATPISPTPFPGPTVPVPGAFFLASLGLGVLRRWRIGMG